MLGQCPICKSTRWVQRISFTAHAEKQCASRFYNQRFSFTVRWWGLTTTRSLWMTALADCSLWCDQAHAHIRWSEYAQTKMFQPEHLHSCNLRCMSACWVNESGHYKYMHKTICRRLTVLCLAQLCFNNSPHPHYSIRYWFVHPSSWCCFQCCGSCCSTQPSRVQPSKVRQQTPAAAAPAAAAPAAAAPVHILQHWQLQCRILCTITTIADSVCSQNRTLVVQDACNSSVKNAFMTDVYAFALTAAFSMHQCLMS